MRIALKARITPVKGGALAQNDKIGLAGQGSTDEEAMLALRHAIEAWCRGLLAGQRLEQALHKRGVKWTSGGELVTVDLERT